MPEVAKEVGIILIILGLKLTDPIIWSKDRSISKHSKFILQHIWHFSSIQPCILIFHKLENYVIKYPTLNNLKEENIACKLHCFSFTTLEKTCVNKTEKEIRFK